MKYPGLAYLGSGKISALYGLNETIHDQKSIGLQHLYIDDYETDFIYSATTCVKLDNRCYYGDRIKARLGHPLKQKSSQSYCHKGFDFVDVFEYDKFRKTDSVFCADKETISFNCTIENTSSIELEFEVASFVITTANDFTLTKQGEDILFHAKGKEMTLAVNEEKLLTRVSKDAPSGFSYHGIQDILFNENVFNNKVFKSSEPIAVSMSKKIVLHPNEKYCFQWALSISQSKIPFKEVHTLANNFWENWLGESNISLQESAKAKLIALKAINMNGFLPADLTGHYFASNDVSFYVRDALHGSRAFLYSGHFNECKEIVNLISKLSRRENHEIFQRYNSKLLPDEGANNNVFSQIDFIGYLLRVVADYYHLTGHLLIETDDLLREVMILDNIKSKNGLFGPEGGVNEGVYGKAYITSTNMFIVGGLLGLLDLLREENKNASIDYIQKRIHSMCQGINKTFLQDGYYAYGYVDYHNQLVKRYDTPQLFGASLGYPMDENYKTNFYTLSKIATYFDYGYGYSEQQYHDGPWIFNTSFAAQNAYLLNDFKRYEAIIHWLDSHTNAYSLLPEAIDARDESKSFINPLMWANAEYICAKYVEVIASLRKGELNDS